MVERRAAHPFRRPVLRRVALVGWALATVVAAVLFATGVSIDNSVGIWFPKDDPALTQYRDYLADFGRREWMLVALDRSSTPVQRVEADTDSLLARLARLEHVHRVVSSRDVPPQVPLARSLFRPVEGGPTEAVLLLITNDIDRQDGYREALVEGIRRVRDGLRTVPQVHVAGTAVINGELNRAARRDMILFFPLVSALVVLLGLLLFQNVRDTVVLASVSFGTVIVTQGLLVGRGHPLNMITIMLPTVLMALSIADAVHLIHAYHTQRRSHSDPFAAAWASVRVIAWPCLGTTATTIAGFLAFSGSSVVPVRQLALYASFGIALAWVLTLTVAPILIATLWGDAIRSEPPTATMGTRVLGSLWKLVDTHPRAVGALSLLVGISLFGWGSLVADTDYVKFFHTDARVPTDYRAIAGAALPQNGLHLIFRAPTGHRVVESEYLDPLRAFADSLEAVPGVHSVLSPFLLADVSAAVGVELDPSGFFAEDARQAQLVAMTDYPSSRQLNTLIARIRSVAEHQLPSDLVMKPTGTSLLWAHMDDGVIETQRQSLLIVCTVCLVILLVLFRSVWLAGVGLAVSLLPVGVVLGLMGFWGIPVNMATVLIAGIAVGLAVDDTIHFVHAYREARTAGAAPRIACDSSVREVGLRMAVTSAVLVGAFAVMGLSDFMPTSQFGLLSSLTIVLAFAADLTVLPLVLSWRGRFGSAAVHRSSDELKETYL